MEENARDAGGRARITGWDLPFLQQGWLVAFLLTASLALVLAQGFGRSHRSIPLASYYMDSSVYLGGAESLHSGAGYRESALIGHPSITLYPPLHSLFLAPWWKPGGIFGRGWIASRFP